MSYFDRLAKAARSERAYFGKERLDPKHLRTMPLHEARAKWPDAKFTVPTNDPGNVLLAWNDALKDFQPAERFVSYKTSNPKLHNCGPACQNAKGETCECICDGVNHGINAAGGVAKASFDAGWPMVSGGGPRWDESAHPRGKTTPASTPGSFAPAATATPPQYAHGGVELTPYVRSRIRDAARQGWVLVQNGAEHDAVTNLISARLDPNFGRWRDVAENLTADLFAYRDAMRAFPGKLQFPRENDDGSDLEAKLAAFLRSPPTADAAEPQSVLDARRARAAAAQAQYRVQSAAAERARQEADWNRPEPAAMTKDELKRWDLGQPIPDHLPEAHNHIFNTRDSQLAYIDDLISSKSAEATQASALNAARRFGGVLRGELPRRAPVSVRQRADGRFEVVDGNSTVAALKLYGWHRVPVRVVG